MWERPPRFIMSNAGHFSSGIPSNTYPVSIVLLHPFTRLPYTYGSTEHRFHACKPDEPEWHDYIAAGPTWKDAKMRGHEYRMTPEQIARWDATDAVIAMYEANFAKYTQDQTCRHWLLQTGDARLVERRRDKIWGDGLDGTGRNQLGLILELIRAQIR